VLLKEDFQTTELFPRTVVIQFPSYQKALDWYNSDEYKPIREIRFKNAKSIAIIIEGA